MKENRKVNPQDGGERGNDSKAALLLQERKKIIYNLILVGTAGLIVLIGVLTMAWFANNTKVNGTNMSVTVQAPKGVEVSLGKKNGNFLDKDNEGKVIDPTNVMTEGDWSESFDISAYYRFGRLLPASSVSGDNIFYVTDAADAGKTISSGAYVYQANGSNGMEATAFVLSDLDDANESFWSGYERHLTWQNVNDDGYFADIPIWFRADSSNAPMTLTVEGCVGPKTGSIVSDSNDATVDALYKSVRVALLQVTVDENEEEVLTPAAGANNVIALRNSLSLDGGGASIVDSGLYLARNNLGSGLFAINVNNLTASHALKETGDGKDYAEYGCYSNSAVVNLPSTNESWSTAKYYIRIWIDGDDKDCWNATAGQDWCINLRFSKIEE